MAGNKPKVRFCWHCGRRLRGTHHATHVTPLKQLIILHKECKEIMLGKKEDWKIDIGDER